MTTETQTLEIHADRWDAFGPVPGTRRVVRISRQTWLRALDTDACTSATREPWAWELAMDYDTDEIIRVAVAPCGAGCRCAAAWQPI
jgi:hypothetical protein